jgi:hypothetical protein
MSEFTEFVRELYEKWLQEHKGQGVFNLKDAWADIWPEIQRAIEEDGLRVDVETAAFDALSSADQKLIERGKRALHKEWRSGQGSIDGGDWLSAVIPLGNNDRVQFGDMGFDEYTRSDALRYGNLRDVQNGYDDWRRRTASYVPHMRSGLTIREILDAGLVDPEQDAPSYDDDDA